MAITLHSGISSYTALTNNQYIQQPVFSNSTLSATTNKLITQYNKLSTFLAIVIVNKEG